MTGTLALLVVVVVPTKPLAATPVSTTLDLAEAVAVPTEPRAATPVTDTLTLTDVMGSVLNGVVEKGVKPNIL